MRAQPEENLLSELVHAVGEDGEAAQHGGPARRLPRAARRRQRDDDGADRQRGARVRRFPQVADQLKAHPELVNTFVEETLRYYPPFPATIRRTMRDVEVSRHDDPEGHRLLVMLGSANHDETAFPGAGRVHHRPRAEPAPGVRHGHPLLPGRAAGTTRRPDRDADARPADQEAQDRREGEGGALRPGGPDRMMVKFELNS